MDKSKLLQIVMIAWLLLFVGFAVFKIINAPILCWDGAETDPVTGEINLVGGCDPAYSQAITQLILPFIIWGIVLILLLFIYFKFKKYNK